MAVVLRALPLGGGGGGPADVGAAGAGAAVAAKDCVAASLGNAILGDKGGLVGPAPAVEENEEEMFGRSGWPPMLY